MSVLEHIDRFYANVVMGPEQCHVWVGNNRGNGYGRIRFDGRVVSPHRWIYEHYKGPIPTGLQIDHLCRNTLCVNPKHLEAVTQRENLLRGTNQVALQAQQTHCKHGHEFTPENTYVGPTKGDRQCRTCKRNYDTRRRNGTA